MTLTSSIRLAVAASLRNDLDLGSALASTRLDRSINLATGTGAGQADRIFADTRTLAASGTEDLDLAGALADGLGGVAAFARVKALVVVAAAANTNNVLVSRPASNGFAGLFAAAGDQINLRPGAFLAVAAGDEDVTGYAVTAGTGDLITVTNSGAGTSVSYDVVVIGASV